jgi:hypothetical protein
VISLSINLPAAPPTAVAKPDAGRAGGEGHDANPATADFSALLAALVGVLAPATAPAPGTAGEAEEKATGAGGTDVPAPSGGQDPAIPVVPGSHATPSSSSPPTPAVPATPATPGSPDGPATPAVPATPATPASAASPRALESASRRPDSDRAHRVGAGPRDDSQPPPTGRAPGLHRRPGRIDEPRDKPSGAASESPNPVTTPESSPSTEGAGPAAASPPARPAAKAAEVAVGAAPAATPPSAAASPPAAHVDAPVTAPPATPAVPSPPVHDQIVSAVVPLHGRGDGRHEVTLELRPEELGVIRVDVSVEHQTVHLTLHAADADTGRLLADALPELRSALTEAGLTAGHVGVGADGRQAGRHHPSANHGTIRPSRPGDPPRRVAPDGSEPVGAIRPVAAGRLDLLL